MIRIAKHENFHARIVVMASELAGVLDCIIIVGSLGFLSSNLRAKVLFSEWGTGDEPLTAEQIKTMLGEDSK